MNKNSFILSFKIIKKKNNYNLLFVLCITMATFLPIILFGIAQSLINQVYESKKEVYGEFTDIYYVDNQEFTGGDIWIDDEDIHSCLPGFSYGKYGVFYTVLQATLLSEEINIGYVDETGLELGNIKFIQGSYPQNDDEIALSKSMQSKLSDKLQNADFGEHITINDNNYIIVGIFEDYGTLWPKGSKQTQENFKSMNAFVTKDESSLLYKEYDFLKRQILFDSNSDVSNTISNNDNFFHNINAQLTEEETLFRIPTEFLVILYFCSVIILYNILNLSKENIKNRMNIYHLLGMQKKDIRNSFFIEYSLLGLGGIILGLIIGYLINTILLYFIQLKLKIDLKMYFGIIYIWIIGVIFSTVFISELIFYYTNLFNSTRRKSASFTSRKNTSVKKTGLRRLIFIEYKSHANLMFSLGFLILFSCILLEYCTIYKNSFIKNTEYVEVEGKMAHDFDYQFFTLPGSQEVGNEDVIYFCDTYELNGATEDIVHRMENDESFELVKKYKENHDLWILLNSNVMDEYLDASDWLIDNKYNEYSEINTKIFDLFDYDRVQTVRTKMVGYSENELRGFSKYLKEGVIDISKLLSGEEVILMAPAFTLTYQEDGGIRKDFVRPDTQDAFHDTLFHAGDSITLSGLVSKTGYEGGVTEEEAEEILERKDTVVKIGAIIPYYVGWWETEVTMGETYYILTLNDAFDALGYPATYNRIDIFADSNTSIKSVTEKVNEYGSELTSMYLEDRISELENYRRLNVIIKAFTTILSILVISVTIISISCQMLMKTKLNSSKYSLLRINGMNLKHFGKMWAIQLGLIGCISSLLSIPSILFFIHVSARFKQDNLSDLIGITDFIQIILFILVLLFLTIIPSLKYLKDKGIRGGL